MQNREWQTEPPFAVGSRVAFVARCLGRRLAHTYRVRELVPGERLVMSTSEGPFHGLGDAARERRDLERLKAILEAR